MLFVGVDLGWTTGATGLAVLRIEGGHLAIAALSLARRHDEALEWIEQQTSASNAMIAIDAPTVIRNQTGQRPGERELNSVFRKQLLACHPANLGRPFAYKTTAFAAALEARGFLHAAAIEPRIPGRYQIEVFPHAAIVRLFQLECRLPYKKGRVAQRAAMLEVLGRHIESLRDGDPPLFATDLPSIHGAKGRARKDVEDKLDAILCAYVGAYYWYWGLARNDVFGNQSTGYLVVPKPLDAREPINGVRGST
jgi:predicted RNase H-like nuclease